VIEFVRGLKAQPGRSIMTDGSSQLMHALLRHELVDELHLLLYPLTLGKGKRLFPEALTANFGLKSGTPYPTGVVGPSPSSMSEKESNTPSIKRDCSCRSSPESWA
jgi:dihydrofolate reductase